MMKLSTLLFLTITTFTAHATEPTPTAISTFLEWDFHARRYPKATIDNSTSQDPKLKNLIELLNSTESATDTALLALRAAQELASHRTTLTDAQIQLRLLVLELAGPRKAQAIEVVSNYIEHSNPMIRWRALMALRNLKAHNSPQIHILTISTLESVLFLPGPKKPTPFQDEAVLKTMMKELIGDDGPLATSRTRTFVWRLLEHGSDNAKLSALVLDALQKSRRFYKDEVLKQLIVRVFDVYQRHKSSDKKTGEVRISSDLRTTLAKAVRLALYKNIHDPSVDAHIVRIAQDKVLAGADQDLIEYLKSRGIQVDTYWCDSRLK